MIKGFIFDMDGLMFDSESLYRAGWTKAAEHFGQEDNKEFHNAVCGTSGETMIHVVQKYYPDVDPDAYVDYCIGYVDQSLLEYVPVKPGLMDILEYAKCKGMKIAVASSSPKQIIERNLKKANVADYFDAVVSGQEVQYGKPSPDIFLLAAERLGLDPSECYVFEDGFNGICAGSAAGCKVIMVPDQMMPTPEIKEKCFGIFKTLAFARDYLAMIEE